MKKISSFIALFTLACMGFAQTSDTTTTTNQNRTGNSNNEGWQDTTGMYRWNDPAYRSRNRSNFDSMIRMQRGYWNEDQGYFVRGAGDTIRPYNQQQWLLDSLNFERRNWDSLSYWKNDYRWGDTSNNSNLQGNNPGPGNPANMNQNESTSTETTRSTSTETGTTSSVTTDTTTTNKSSGTMPETSSNTGTASSTNERKKDNDKIQSSSSSKGYASAKGNSEDGIFMKKNKVMVRRDGITSKVTGSIRLNDGVVVLSNGMITMPDGTTRKMVNGESYSMNGLNGDTGQNKKQ